MECAGCDILVAWRDGNTRDYVKEYGGNFRTEYPSDFVTKKGSGKPFMRWHQRTGAVIG
jgi:hypothetical protein